MTKTKANIIIAVSSILLVLGGFALGAKTTQGTVQNQLQVECTYPYGKDGFLTNNCYALINMALKAGFKVSHDEVRPDGSVTFVIK